MKDYKVSNEVFKDVIAGLKKTIPPIDENINGELMKQYEQAIEYAESGKRYEFAKYLRNFNAGMLMGSAIASASMQNLELLIGSGLVYGPCALISDYLYNKYKARDCAIARLDYAKFLQQLSENYNDIQYPFEIGNPDTYDELYSYWISLKMQNYFEKKQTEALEGKESEDFTKGE